MTRWLEARPHIPLLIVAGLLLIVGYLENTP
jgi:hypothetical protein